jgi:hypothetical protein
MPSFLLPPLLASTLTSSQPLLPLLLATMTLWKLEASWVASFLLPPPLASKLTSLQPSSPPLLTTLWKLEASLVMKLTSLLSSPSPFAAGDFFGEAVFAAGFADDFADGDSFRGALPNTILWYC